MKLIRKLGLAMAGALVLAAALLVPVVAASEAQPEISDVKGDSKSLKDSRDLVAAFFHDETNDTFMINMTVAALETYTNPSDLPSAPTTEYEVYFSVAESNYAVACKVPVHGPLGFTIQFDIRAVSYGNNSTTENQLSTLSGCTYDYNTNNIQWLVSKAQFYNLTAGTRLTRTWAAVYSKAFQDPQRHIEDRGPNNGYGKDYIIRGSQGSEIINVELIADNLTQPCAPNSPAVFKVSVFNNGTSQVNVELFNGSVDKKGWTVTLSLDNMTLLPNATRILTVTVECPRDAANKTSVTVSVSGKARASSSNQTANTKILYLTATVNYLPPKPPAELWWKTLLNWLTKPTYNEFYYIWGVVGLVIALSVGGYAYVSVRRRRAETVAATPPPVPAK